MSLPKSSVSETSGENYVIRDNLLNHRACLVGHAAAEHSAILQSFANSLNTDQYLSHMSLSEKQMINNDDLSKQLFVVYITTSTQWLCYTKYPDVLQFKNTHYTIKSIFF